MAQTPTISKGRPPGCNAVGTAVAVAGLKCEEFGDDGSPIRQTKFTFTNLALTITEISGSAEGFASQQIYDFPLGYINILSAVFTGTLTTTSVIADTLNSGVVVNLGIGTAATVGGDAGVLATTRQNVIPGSGETSSGFTSSTVINVASASITTVFAASVSAAHLAVQLPGQSTAVDLFLNLGVPTANDIDADATVTVNGTLVVTWINTMSG